MDTESTPKPRYLRRTNCVKCSQNGDAVLNGKDVYCKSCFDDYCAHKFRSSFGKNKIFQKPNQRVLIAVSGGPISLGILSDLIRRSCDLGARKKLQIVPEILHVVEPFSNFLEDKSIDSLKCLNLPIHFFHLASIFDDDSSFGILSQLDGTAVGSDNNLLLEKLFQSFSNQTSRLDFYRRLKTLLFVRCARRLGIEYLIVGETCTNLSSRILSNATQGRGGQTRDDVSVLDLRWFSDAAGVRILRPLREFQTKEIAYYNHFHRLYSSIDFSFEKPDFIPATNSITSSSTLQSVSNEFVEDLQSRFPATVNTLFASASKLLSTEAALKKGTNDVDSKINRCRLCASIILDDEDNDETMIVKGFCYGCNLSLSDLDDTNRLPSWLINQ